MAVVLKQEVEAPSQPRQWPAWVLWMLSLGFLLLAAPLAIGAAVLEAYSIGENELE